MGGGFGREGGGEECTGGFGVGGDEGLLGVEEGLEGSFGGVGVDLVDCESVG